MNLTGGSKKIGKNFICGVNEQLKDLGEFNGEVGGVVYIGGSPLETRIVNGKVVSPYRIISLVEILLKNRIKSR